MNTLRNIILIPAMLCLSLAGFAQTFTNFTTTDGLIDDNVLDMSLDASDNIWFATQNGITLYDGTTWTSYTTADGLVDNTVEAIFIDAAGNMWAGTSFGLSKFDGTSWTTFTETDGLGDNRVYCINEDASGNMVFGTIDGFSVYDGTNWTSYTNTDGLPFGGVNDIRFRANGNYYLGTSLGGISIFDGTNFTEITETDGLVDDKIRALTLGSQNSLWVATASGISVFNSSDAHTGDHTQIFTLPPPDTLNPVEDVKVDSQGNIWAGVYVDYLVTEGGISWYNGAQWVQYEVSDGLAGPVVRSVEIDGNDNVWVGTSTGVSRITNVPGAVDPALASVSFQLYPNPVSEVLYIRFEDAQQAKKTQVTLFNLNLQQVASQRVNAHQTLLKMPIAHLREGIYLLQVGNVIRKVSIQ